MLDVRLKFYEREKNIRMNILRKQQRQLERTRTSLDREATRLPSSRLSARPSTAWMAQRAKPMAPELIITDWETQQENLPTSTDFVANDGIRPHTAA